MTTYTETAPPSQQERRHFWQRFSKPPRYQPWPLCSFKENPKQFSWNIVVLIAWIGILAYFGKHFFAGLYYATTQTTEWADSRWHALVPNDNLRHDIRDNGESFYAAFFFLMFSWNYWRPLGIFARVPPFKWIHAGMTWVEVHILHIGKPNDGEQSTKFEHFIGLLLTPVYAAPGFIFGRWVAMKVGVDHSSFLESKVIGVFAAFFFGRRPAKPFFDDMQLHFVRRRIASGRHLSPLAQRLLPPTYVARYFHEAQTMTVTQARRERPFRVKLAVGLMVFAAVAFFTLGLYVMQFIAP